MSNSIRHDPNFHFHRPQDPTQIRTAQRGTIAPTWGDRRRAAWRDSGSPRLESLAAFSFALRAGVLEGRRAAASAEYKLSKGGALLRRSIANAFSKDGKEVDANFAAYHHANAAAKAKLEIRKTRIDAKLEVGKAMDGDELEHTVDEQNAGVQRKLREMGYVPTAERQSEVAHAKAEARYLLGDTGHRVQKNVDQAPGIARKLASGASALHDSRMRGLSRAAAEAALGAGAAGYALLQTAKRGTYGLLKHAAPPGSADRTTFDRRGDAAGARARMALAARHGTRELNIAVERESARREEKLERTLTGYNPAPALPGTSPVAVGWTARAINDYMADGGNPDGLRANAAAAYLGFKNAGQDIRAVAHDLRAGLADARMRRGDTDSRAQKAASAAAQRHRNQALKAAFQKRSNEAAMKGGLKAEVARQQERIARSMNELQPGRPVEKAGSETDSSDGYGSGPATPASSDVSVDRPEMAEHSSNSSLLSNWLLSQDQRARHASLAQPKPRSPRARSALKAMDEALAREGVAQAPEPDRAPSGLSADKYFGTDEDRSEATDSFVRTPVSSLGSPVLTPFTPSASPSEPEDPPAGERERR